MIRGDNPTLLKVQYFRPDRKRGIKECFHVIYRDDNNRMRFSNEPPDVDIYIVKPENRDFNYMKPQEKISRMEKYTVPLSKVRYTIAEQAGKFGEQILHVAEQTMDPKVLDNLYKWPYAYGCDFLPEFYFMRDWYYKYKLRSPKLYKAFLDIEVDQIDYKIDMDNPRDSAWAPINVITVGFDDPAEMYQFILKPQEPHGDPNLESFKERYKLYEKQLHEHEYLMSNKDEYIKLLHSEFDKTYGSIDYKINDYEKEIDLIADVFRLINDKKPDFCDIWNMRFDIPYIIGRCEHLGFDPISIICHPDIEPKQCYFVKDTRFFDLEKQWDQFFCSSYTQYECQMRIYANIRKSEHKLKSHKLNDVAEKELKDKKVEYASSTNIVNFPYVDWMKFLLYNLKDVLLIRQIEKHTNDLLTFYMRSHNNLTPYNKIFKETHLLRCVREMYFEKEGWVQSNNINILKLRDKRREDREFYGEDYEEETKTSYKGAINADPLMNDNVGEVVFGRKTNYLFRNAIDFDFSSFYPSIKIACNLDPGTLLYKAKFNNEDFISGEFSNKSLNQTYTEINKYGQEVPVDITGEAVNCFCSKNPLTFGYNYLNLPEIDELVEIIENKLNN